MKDIEKYEIKSNGYFGILIPPYAKKQHPNQQAGLDFYVDVINFNTGRVCSLKLYNNTAGMYFKMNGSHYLSEFTEEVTYIPFQVIKK